MKGIDIAKKTIAIKGADQINVRLSQVKIPITAIIVARNPGTTCDLAKPLYNPTSTP